MFLLICLEITIAARIFKNIYYEFSFLCFREETEIIEGEVVEIQIDRPATGTVSSVLNVGVTIKILIFEHKRILL